MRSKPYDRKSVKRSPKKAKAVKTTKTANKTSKSRANPVANAWGIPNMRRTILSTRRNMLSKQQQQQQQLRLSRQHPAAQRLLQNERLKRPNGWIYISWSA